MKKTIQKISASIFLILFSIAVHAQDYTFDDFVGTWNGTIMSPGTGGATVPTTMIISANGFYTETSGYLMPSLYPNTQQCEYQAATNRMHWWYLGTAWGGQYFYDHFYYEVVYFNNGILEMHYNYWDDPEPHPEVGTIYLVKEGVNTMPSPESLAYEWMDNSVKLSWDEPVLPSLNAESLTGYHIYHQEPGGDFELLAFAETNAYDHVGMFAAGMHSYYVTAVYDDGESEPSDEVMVNFLTPAPTQLSGELLGDLIVLNWEEPVSGVSAMATLEGYNIYHMPENGTFGMLGFSEEPSFVHENPASIGTQSYYVTAVYYGGESEPSNQTEVLYQVTGFSENNSISASIYPNPASDYINISAAENMQKVSLMNLSGQVVWTDKINANSHTLELSQFAAGIWVLLIETSRGAYSQQVVIK